MKNRGKNKIDEYSILKILRLKISNFTTHYSNFTSQQKNRRDKNPDGPT